jgi:hypothetical protein
MITVRLKADAADCYHNVVSGFSPDDEVKR